MRAPDRNISLPFRTSVTRSMASPLATLAFAMLAAAGVFLPWAEGINWSKRGWSYEHGLVALVAAAAAAIVCALRASGGRRQGTLSALRAAVSGYRDGRNGVVLPRRSREHRSRRIQVDD
jgi:hypothetical protein